MTKKIYLYGTGIWLILLVLTVLFGAFREAVFIPYTGLNPTLARAVLLPVAIGYIFLLTYLFLKRVEYTRKETILLGLMWLMMTITFEFLFGHYVMGHSWEVLFADYNILKGRTWGLFLLATGIMPFIVGEWLRR